MTRDPVPFLANVIFIAHADGQLSSGETAQLELIRAEMGFKKGDFNKAMRVVEQGGYQLQPAGSFADQIKNLECMLRVAYVDDDLSEEENKLVSEFCHSVGVYQDQLTRLASEVLESLSSDGKRCPSCSQSVANDARFCPACGASLEGKEEVQQVDFRVPDTGLAIQFADSTAATFGEALKAAQGSSDYQTCQRMKKTWHMAVFPSGEVQDALPLAQALSGIRNRKAFLNGQEVPWDELFGFSWCAARRATAYRPVEYCFGKDENRVNPWGCKQSKMDWVEWADWFSYGRWEKGGLLGPKFVWRFDKDRIKHELATNLYRCRFCPHLNTRLFEEVLKLLPDTVNPEKDRDWKYSDNYEQSPGSIKVTVTEGKGDFAYQHEFWSDGVRPVGQKVLADILKTALQNAGANEVSAAALLR
ncbi:MAG: TerB family tellurite resistance protein [Verrucomicrobiales bacterium]|nr:TerB family tellurite resistance protein [Verrucomicrobiales bacterium]